MPSISKRVEIFFVTAPICGRTNIYVRQNQSLFEVVYLPIDDCFNITRVQYHISDDVHIRPTGKGSRFFSKLPQITEILLDVYLLEYARESKMHVNTL